MDIREPRVSVVMSVLNGQHYLREAIDSLLSQSFADFELIVIDNGSSDGTPEIIESYRDPRLVVITNDQTLSISASLNKGLSAARGQLIARLDADDIAKPERLAKQVALMDAQPDVALIGTWWEFFWQDGDGNRVVQPGPETPIDHVGLVNAIASCNPLGHTTLMYRRDPVLAVGGYDEDVAYAQDWALVLTISQNYRLGCLPERVNMARQHPDQLSSVRSWAEIRLLEAADMHRRGLAHPQLSRQGRRAGQRALALVYARLARLWLLQRRPLRAGCAVFQSLQLAPLHVARRVLGGLA